MRIREIWIVFALSYTISRVNRLFWKVLLSNKPSQKLRFELKGQELSIRNVYRELLREFDVENRRWWTLVPVFFTPFAQTTNCWHQTGSNATNEGSSRITPYGFFRPQLYQCKPFLFIFIIQNVICFYFLCMWRTFHDNVLLKLEHLSRLRVTQTYIRMGWSCLI